MLKILVTGGAGFIGSALIRQLIADTDATIINVDALTYAGNLESLAAARHDARHIFQHVDSRNRSAIEDVLREHQPNAIMHLASETHVDRSIERPSAFVETNVIGTQILLEAARDYWAQLPDAAKLVFRFHHISTDEVYGDLGPDDPAFTEETAYAPSSPYAASKAASDHLVRAWHRTYGLPVLLSNCSNNYGPCQFPEKLIPLMIGNALEGKPLPVYGRGDNIRDWLYVEDHARALRRVLADGQPGRTYNIGGHAERTNLQVVQAVCACLEKIAPFKDNEHAHRRQGSAVGAGYSDLISFVRDRPGHDRRYAIDDSRIRQELDWKPLESFETGLYKTVQWYVDNCQWVERVRTGAYRDWIKRNYADRGAAP